MALLPFNETPAQPVRNNSSGSINTSEIDQYRQGVELTMNKFFQSGPVKIHSGEENHILRQNSVGEMRESLFQETTFFQEVDVFDPTTFLQRQVSNNSLSDVLAFRASTTTNGITFDGVIEPLTIRQQITFMSAYSPIEPHLVRGNVEGGNFNLLSNSDKVVIVQKFSGVTFGTNPHVDRVDNVNSKPIDIPFAQKNIHLIKAFDDTQEKSGVILTGSMGTDLQGYLRLMSPDSENYVPDGFISSTSGWDY